MQKDIEHFGKNVFIRFFRDNKMFSDSYRSLIKKNPSGFYFQFSENTIDTEKKNNKNDKLINLLCGQTVC